MKRIQRAIAAATLFAGAVGSAQAQLQFNNSFIAGTSAQAEAAIQVAEDRWSALFSDNVTMNITIGTGALPANVIASTNSTQADYSYASVRTALTNDSKSATDATAVAHLQGGSNFSELINYTANNPNGTGSSTAYLDSSGANTSTIYMANANAKALGLLGAGSATDASMTFSNSLAFDFDPTDGITANTLDFVGVVTHEIGHALGFISGVDILDINSTSPNFFNDNDFTFASTLDLFRYSAASTAAHAIDYTAGNGVKYFSIDGGATVGSQFATGTVHGDGRQASHWKDNLAIGIMDPTFSYGELGAISANDIMAFDAIGWDLNVAAVPEPSTYALFGLGLAALALLRRRTQRA